MPRSQLEKLWLGVGIVAAMIMVVVGYVFFISPQRSDTSSVKAQVSVAQSHNDELRAKINTLQSQTKNLARYETIVKQAQLALPSTSGLPDFLRTLQSIGRSSLASVSALTIGTPSDVTSLARTAPTTASTPAPTTPTTSSTAPATTPTPPVSSTRVYALTITAQVSGSIQQLDEFLTQLQSVQPRAVLISQITLGSSSTASTSTTTGGAAVLSLTMQAFVAPSGAAERSQLAAAAGK